MESKKKCLGRVLKDIFSAFGLCRGTLYIVIGIVAYVVASSFGFNKGIENINSYIQYLGAAVGLSFTAYSIILNFGGHLSKFAPKADDGKSPLENLFAVFTSSICIHLLTLAVLFIFDGIRNIYIWYVVVGLLSVCLISLCDVGLIIFTLHRLFMGPEIQKNGGSDGKLSEKGNDGDKCTSCFWLYFFAIVALIIAIGYYLIVNAYKIQLKSDMEKRIEVKYKEVENLGKDSIRLESLLKEKVLNIKLDVQGITKT